LAHLIELEWLDDRHHQLHRSPIMLRRFRLNQVEPPLTGKIMSQAACQLLRIAVIPWTPAVFLAARMTEGAATTKTAFF
jgi:hypothetical protein